MTGSTAGEGTLSSRIGCAAVVPSLGRPSLLTLLEALANGSGPALHQVIVVDDRPPRPAGPPALGLQPGWPALPVQVVATGGVGPAAARNRGWREASAEWVVFLDDDVVPRPDWKAHLASDLATAAADVVGVHGRVAVPLPDDRRPTDFERSTAGLATARWITADAAYRRRDLVAIGGFDERFRRAYREDADLGLRMSARGRLVTGTRTVDHPVRPAPWHMSIGAQAGNADDTLMRALHGHDWRARAGAPAGRRRRHMAVTAAGALAIIAGATGRRSVARAAGLAWAAGTAELVAARIAPGPRTAGEVAAMVATSVAIPPTATAWWLAGTVRWRLRPPPPHRGTDSGPTGRPALLQRARTERPPTGGGRNQDGALVGEADSGLTGPPARHPPASLVLFDRDGTLIDDVPYNGDPSRVQPRPGARPALDRLRQAGVPVAVVSNQSGVGTGRITLEQMHLVNRRTEELLGPFAHVLVCPHRPDDGCRCRKPAPQMVLDAADRMGVEPGACVLVGDIGSDVEAARAAGARSVLVPTDATLPAEINAAPTVADDIEQAVAMILAGGV